MDDHQQPDDSPASNNEARNKRDRAASSVSDEPDHKRAYYDSEQKPLELPDDCLRRVMLFLPFEDRKALQEVNRQWLKIGQEFEELNTEDFMHCIDSESRSPVSRNIIIEDGMCFHCTAFLRTLSQTRGSVRRLNLASGLSEEQFESIQAFINDNLCRGVKHLEVKPCVPPDLIFKNGEDGNNIEVYRQDYDPQPFTTVCNTRRLPQLESLVLFSCMALNDATVETLTEETLPHLHQLDMIWAGSKEMSGCKYELQALDRNWEKFFKELPSTLQQLKLHVLGCCRFLHHLKTRLSDSERPMTHLTSIHLYIDSDSVSNILALEYVCDKLPKQLTELKLWCYMKTWNLNQLLSKMTHLTNLKTFHFTMGSFCTYQDIGSSIQNKTKLQDLQIRATTAGGIRGRQENLYESISQLKELRTLSVPARSATANMLDHLQLPNLRRLNFTHETMSNCGGLPPNEKLVPALTRLVARSPKLDLLEIHRLWTPKRNMADKLLTLNLLSKMEKTLMESRSEVFKSHCKCLKGILSPALIEKCPFCVRMVPPLTVDIGCYLNPDDADKSSHACYDMAQEEDRRSYALDKVIVDTFKRSPYLKVIGIMLQQDDWDAMEDDYDD